MRVFKRSQINPGQSGFSLVEILVGIAIGLIGIMAMLQITVDWDNRKRTVAQGSDAQISGSIAVYQIERDLRLAGYGFGTASQMGCTVGAYLTSRPAGAKDFTFPMVPVLIEDNTGDNGSDIITVLHGNSPTMSASIRYTASTASSKATSTRTGLRLGDRVIVANSTTTCGLIEVTDNTDADGLTIDHASGNYTDSEGATVPATNNSAAGLPVTFTSGSLYNLGSAPSRNIWQINDLRVLASQNDLTTYLDSDGDGENDWTEVADGIINLQAQYGLDTNNDTIVDTWQAGPPGGWPQIRAIRVGLLARSQQYEKTAVTAAEPAWAGGDFVMTNVDGTTDSNPDNPNDWRHYRYRVYEAVVPLRNMVWGTAP